MKRQTKPFAVEIKRSRRSTPLNEPSDSVQNKIVCRKPDIDKRTAAKSCETDTPSEENLDLRIPAFLQTSKEGERPQAPAEALSANANASFWKPLKTAEQCSSRPRILPCVAVASEEQPLTLEGVPATKVRIRSNSSAPAASVIPSQPLSDHAASVPLVIEGEDEDGPEAVSSTLPLNEFASGTTRPNPKRKVHRFLKFDRENSASLPPGQRWKRRILNRAR